MNFKSFFRYLLRYKWIVIFVPIVAVLLTYFLVKELPKQYSSESRISTGLLDPSKKVISDQTVDFFQVSQQFNNIKEKLQMKKIIDILSYNLILHDLEQPKVAFRKPSDKLKELNAGQIAKLIEIYKKRLILKSVLTLEDNKGEFKLFDLIESMGYGEKSLRDKLSITHTDLSDYISIVFVSENAKLSAFVVNTLTTEFISNYSEDVSKNQNTSIALLDSLAKKKAIIMNEKNAALSNFKKNRGVLNLSEQSATVNTQIAQVEAMRADAIRVIQSNVGAISVIESKLRGNDSYVAAPNRAANKNIVDLQNQLTKATNDFVDKGFRLTDQKKIDSLTRLINARSQKNSDDNIFDPKTSRQSLVSQKMNLEIELQKAKSSMSSINRQLGSLRAQYNSMVPYDAEIQNYERDADLALKEYTIALDHYNNSKTDQTTGLKLEIAQLGTVGNALPSKAILYVAGSGITTFMLCISVLLGIFLMDKSIVNNRQLELATKSRVLGNLNKLQSKERIARNIWNDKSSNKEYELYKEHLRSIRFEVLNAIEADNSKILGVTSLVANAGKTFICYSLAYAFAMTGRKILLIADEQSYEQADTKELSTTQNFQTFLQKKEFHTDDLITVMNKSSERNSLLEVQNVKSLKNGFELLKKEFDIVIIDVNSLNDVNISKEWLMFTDKNIAVFESGTTLQDVDGKYINYIKKQPEFLGWILNKIDVSKSV
ncbi:lipopolysaccharide biosynthesis protein [Pedobacter agri]|uniref:exopolysaccharide transport family protein n=1 Tax=Pedobacter agri TaxID=454586 RepID=UPI00292D0F4C|nr:lipopolysaccharide biosynthesis protein [Pedobacter agri]